MAVVSFSVCCFFLSSCPLIGDVVIVSILSTVLPFFWLLSWKFTFPIVFVWNSSWCRKIRKFSRFIRWLICKLLLNWAGLNVINGESISSRRDCRQSNDNNDTQLQRPIGAGDLDKTAKRWIASWNNRLVLEENITVLNRGNDIQLRFSIGTDRILRENHEMNLSGSNDPIKRIDRPWNFN